MNIIDSSVLVKFFLKEPGWEGVKEHIINSVGIELNIKELYNAVWKKNIMKQIILSKEILKDLSEIDQVITIVDQRKYMNIALEVAVANKITVYDSLFIAIAKAQNYRLVTCDVKQAEIAKKLDVKVILC
jgi:predicted nucleic acid-binding protein